MPLKKNFNVDDEPTAVQPTEEELRKQKEDQLVRRFFETKEPVPVVDEAKLDRLRRMGKINALGKGVSVLADALGNGIGATVKQRQPDQVSPTLYQAYQNTLDKFDSDKKAYDYRKYQGDRQDILFGLQRLDNETEQAYRERVQKAKEEQAANKLEFDKDKYEQDFGLKAAAHNLNVAKANETATDHRVKNSIAAEKVNKDNTLQVKTAKQTYNLSKPEAEYLKGEALKNIKLLQDRYPQWFVETPEYTIDQLGFKTPTGNTTLKLDSRIKDDQLISAFLEGEEEKVTNADIEKRRTFTQSLMKGNKKDAAPIKQADQKPITKAEVKSKWGKYARSSK